MKQRWAPKVKGGVAWADWDEFAKAVALAMNRIESKCGAEVTYLREHPPEQQVVKKGALEWRPNPRRKKESDADYLLRVIRDVRNNLFHGGKYTSQRVTELARDRKLIDSATIVLEECTRVDDEINRLVQEPADC